MGQSYREGQPGRIRPGTGSIGESFLDRGCGMQRYDILYFGMGQWQNQASGLVLVELPGDGLLPQYRDAGTCIWT